jgi:hypothetical protein
MTKKRRKPDYDEVRIPDYSQIKTLLDVMEKTERACRLSLESDKYDEAHRLSYKHMISRIKAFKQDAVLTIDYITVMLQDLDKYHKDGLETVTASKELPVTTNL